MAQTVIRGTQILNGSVQRADMNTGTAGQAVITKVIGGTGISLASTGMDSGTGDVTVSASAFGGFVSKTAAYTLTSADSGKYIICSGGSWTLTLPTPAAGLTYQVRNDMGISGTTGTITIATTSGTIDGASTLALLAQQECLIITDGTNWRTFGRQRDLVLGTQDLSSAASGTILLPPGYRYYRFLFENVVPAAGGAAYLTAQISTDGGTTWLSASSYWQASIYNSSATAVAAVNSAATNMGLTNSGSALQACDMMLYPGNGSQPPSWVFSAGGFSSISSMFSFLTQGMYNNAAVIANALKYSMSTGNISVSNLTVKGVV